MILNQFGVHEGGRGPQSPQLDRLRMFKVVFDFIVSIFWYTMRMKIEYDYKILQGEIKHDQTVPN